MVRSAIEEGIGRIAAVQTARESQAEFLPEGHKFEAASRTRKTRCRPEGAKTGSGANEDAASAEVPRFVRVGLGSKQRVGAVARSAGGSNDAGRRPVAAADSGRGCRLSRNSPADDSCSDEHESVAGNGVFSVLVS